MPVPASTTSIVNMPLYVRDELLLPIETDYSVSSMQTLTHPSPLTCLTSHACSHPLIQLTLVCSSLFVCVVRPCQPLLNGRISEAEWQEDCELLQAAYDRNAILQRLRTQLTQYTVRQHTFLHRLCTALSMVVCCCLCVLLDSQSERLRLALDVARQRNAVLVAYVETMKRKYQYRQLIVTLEHDTGTGSGSGKAGGMQWFSVRLERTSPSDRAGIVEEARVAGRHARGRSHQRQKSASVMGHAKRLLSASSTVQVVPYVPPAIILPPDDDDVREQEAVDELF